MQKQYWSNIRNQRTPAPTPQQRLQTIADVSPEQQEDVWPKQSVFDINFAEFFRASSESTNEAIRQTMSQLRALDQAEAAAAAEAVFGPGEGGYGVVEESQPATETFADQF